MFLGAAQRNYIIVEVRGPRTGMFSPWAQGGTGIGSGCGSGVLGEGVTTGPFGRVVVQAHFDNTSVWTGQVFPDLGQLISMPIVAR